MKVIISEEQFDSLERKEFYRKLFYNYWKSRGPKIDKTFFDLFDYQSLDISFGSVLTMLSEFIGVEKAMSMAEDILSKSGKIFYGDCGGYEFDFVTSVNEKLLAPNDYHPNETNKIVVEVKVRTKGGSVQLIMVDGSTHSLKDALDNEDYGWEIKGEVSDCLDGYFLDNVEYKTGIVVVIEDIIFV